MNIQEFIDEVISRKNKQITDEVFLLIQNNHQLMYDYLKLVETEGLTKVNQSIGLAVKKRYGLLNDEDRQETPESTLIQSHQKFE